jgi:hypothetical protein
MNLTDLEELAGHSFSPVQRIALKLFYGIALDNQKTFEIYNHLNSLDPTEYTEESYVELAAWVGAYDKHGNQTCWDFGRRSGSSLLLDTILKYEGSLYKTPSEALLKT